MAIFKKLFAYNAVASSGTRVFKRLRNGVQISPESGLYDTNNKLLASWDTLIFSYDMHIRIGIAKYGTIDPCVVFSENSALSTGTKLIIDARCSYIDNDAFGGCTSLTSVVIPDSVTDIGNSAFGGCTSLTSVTIGNSVTKIRSEAFYNCPSLTDVYYRGTQEQWNAITIDNTWNANEALLNATIHYNSQ